MTSATQLNVANTDYPKQVVTGFAFVACLTLIILGILAQMDLVPLKNIGNSGSIGLICGGSFGLIFSIAYLQLKSKPHETTTLYEVTKKVTKIASEPSQTSEVAKLSKGSSQVLEVFEFSDKRDALYKLLKNEYWHGMINEDSKYPAHKHWVFYVDEEEVYNKFEFNKDNSERFNVVISQCAFIEKNNLLKRLENSPLPSEKS